MSLKKNIIANYASQIYVTLIGIVMMPLYIKYMGAEAYGLVGFFAMLQAWFNLLDLGLSPTVAREAARHQGGAMSNLEYRRLVRALEGVFIFVSLIGGTALLLSSSYIAEHWLKVTALHAQDVVTALQLMAIIVALRWASGLYRGVISGSQRMVWLSGFNASIASLRFVGVIPLLIYVGVTPTYFFGFQLAVAIVELTLLCFFAYRLLPGIGDAGSLVWDWAPLKPVLKFSLSIAFTSSVWVLVTQTDKLVLSKLLPLAEYGYFTLAVMVASGVLLLSGPVSTAIMPRLAQMEAEGDHNGLISVYRQATQLVTVLAGSAAITVALCAEPLLWVLTDNREISQRAAPVLALYALGNGILAVSAFPYYLQYAKGDLRLHLIGNALFVIMLVPLIIWGTSRYGAIGGGYVWLGVNLMTFFAWLPFLHRRFAPGLNWQWYGEDIFRIAASALVIGSIAHEFLVGNENRWIQLMQIVAVGVTAVLGAVLAVPGLTFRQIRSLTAFR